MAYPLFVLCRSDETITSEIMKASISNEHAFEKARTSVEQVEGSLGWSRITIYWSHEKKPIVLSCYLVDECRSIVNSIADELPPPHSASHIHVRDRLAETVQAVRIDIDPESLSEAVWTSLDCIEAYIAYRFHGLIFAPDEGLYDEGLALLYPM
jgi:hypothetical protein